MTIKQRIDELNEAMELIMKFMCKSFPMFESTFEISETFVRIRYNLSSYPDNCNMDTLFDLTSKLEPLPSKVREFAKGLYSPGANDVADQTKAVENWRHCLEEGIRSDAMIVSIVILSLLDVIQEMYGVISEIIKEKDTEIVLQKRFVADSLRTTSVLE